MKRVFRRFLMLILASVSSAESMPSTAPAVADSLLAMGLLDVTQPPYLADSSGERDSTEAIQRAINDARDKRLVCFFPTGTFLISDTLSCEQEVEKLDAPRYTDGRPQHYWNKSQRIVIFGSTRGKRPVLKLSRDAKGFDDPKHPKLAVWIWAQSRYDAPGKEEPVWGEEQPNIAFSHVFKGVDIDVSGHAGAIGIRHSGAQGSALLDATIHAEGAYAGLSDCPGQGGGTYNVEVHGGRYGIVIDSGSRFPLLASCAFIGQTEAAIRYFDGGSQVPTLLVGCRVEPASTTVVDFTTEPGYAGISLIDCIVQLKPGGVIAKTKQSENIYLENTFVRGAEAISSSGGAKISSPKDWTQITRYSSHTDKGLNLINGVSSTGEVVDMGAVSTAPSYEDLCVRHYTPGPSFEDPDVVNVKSFGAQGGGKTDDTQAFEKAIVASDKVFVPKGSFLLSRTLQLRSNTHLFGLTHVFSDISRLQPDDLADTAPARGAQRRSRLKNSTPLIRTVDDADAAPGVSFLGVEGRIEWRSGKSISMLSRAATTISGHGGGRFYAMRSQGGQLQLKGITQPTQIYALNVERVATNPQSLIQNCSNLRIYYFKVEAGTLQKENAGDANTAGRIADSTDVRVHCMYGNVRNLGDRPMLEVQDSTDTIVSQLSAFTPSTFHNLAETFDGVTKTISSSNVCALFVRAGKEN